MGVALPLSLAVCHSLCNPHHPSPRSVNWNLDTLDWLYAASSPTTVYTIVSDGIANLSPGGIIHLQHDRVAESVATVRTIIAMVRSAGYKFVGLDECLWGKGNHYPAPGTPKTSLTLHPVADAWPAERAFAYKDCTAPTQGTNADCLLSQWSEWSPCPDTCGDDTRSRSRLVVAPATGTGTCTGESDLLQTESCGNPCGCGDGQCNLDETCATCAEDCGPCQLPGVVLECVNDRDYALTFDDGPSAV